MQKQQLPLNPSSDNKLTQNTSPNPSQTQQQGFRKIKPVILIYSVQDEENPQKILKYYSKASRKESTKSKARFSLAKASSPRTLKAQKKLLRLKSELDFADNFQSSVLFSQFKSIPSLSFFSLIHTNHNPGSLETLWKTLPHLKNLTTFEIILQLIPIQDPKILTRLLKSTKKLNGLVNLALSFFFCPKINPLHFKIFSNHLRRLYQLQALKLVFENSLALSNQKAFSNLISIFPRLSLLSKLHLSFDRLEQVPRSDILELFMSFQRLRVLSDLTIIFKYCEITHLNEKEPLHQIFTYLNLPLLEKLKLRLFRNLDDECLETLSHIIRNLSSLQTLSLNMSDSKGYINEGFEDFGLSLSRLVSLSSLSLHVPLTVLPALETIASILESLCNLVKLELGILERSTEDSFQDYKQLFTNIRLLKSLKFLEITIPHDHTIADEDLEILSESLKGLITLKDLSLDFGFSGYITNKGIEALSSSIKKLEDLSGLALRFSYNDKLNDKTLSILGEALSNRPLLSSIKLAFVQCSGIEGFGDLFQVFTEMKDTRNIILHIPASKFSGPEADYLKQRNIYQNAWVP